MADPLCRDVLTFRAGGESFALLAAEVAAIVRPPPLTRVPLAPASLLGLANVRGAVLPVVSLAGLLGLAPSPATPANRVVVVDGASRTMTRLGLLVDAIGAVARQSAAETLDLPTLLAAALGGLLRRKAAAAHDFADPPRLGAAARHGPPGRALLSLVAGGQEFALPLERVGDILALPASSATLPGAGAGMLGMIAVRDALLPLVSLRELLGMPRETPDRRAARIIVTEAAGHRVGLVVDAARSILRVAADAIDPVPPVLSRGLGEARIEAVCRLDDGARLVAILAPDGLFDVATLARLAALPQATTAAPREQHDATEQFLVFAAGENRYGLPVAAVAEVLRCPDEMTAVPRAPPLLAGMMSWRGIALPVIDPRRQFASHDATASPPRSGRQRVVVLTAADMRTGILVQDEPALLALSHAELAGLPELTHAGSQIFGRVAPIDRGDRMILLIDPSRLLSEAAREVVVACRVSHAAVEAAASCL